MKPYSWTRWAIQIPESTWLVGKFYWPDATLDEIPIRTFRTREEARAAMQRLRCSGGLKPVKVTVSITQRETP